MKRTDIVEMLPYMSIPQLRASLKDGYEGEELEALKTEIKFRRLRLRYRKKRFNG